MRSKTTKKNSNGQFQDGFGNKLAGRDLNECSKAVDFYYDNVDLEKYYELCDKGEKNSPKARALRKTLEKRGYNLEDSN